MGIPVGPGGCRDGERQASRRVPRQGEDAGRLSADVTLMTWVMPRSAGPSNRQQIAAPNTHQMPSVFFSKALFRLGLGIIIWHCSTFVCI